MIKPLFKVIKPGLYASIQDKGRHGFQQYGVPVSGALDRYAHHMANYILGNDSYSATLEVTMLGTKMFALSDHVIALTGADLNATVDRLKAPLWKSFKVYQGQTLHFQNPIQGARAYLAVSGGIDRQPVLKSRSTYARGKIYDVLKENDVICTVDQEKRKLSQQLSPKWIPDYKQEIELHVIPSHHEPFFETESIDLFYKQVYTLKSGDRMGCMIEGEQALVHKKTSDLISECTTFGTIQVPPSGQPIILLADSQTTGGYPTLGTIMSEDLWKIAQLLPNGKLTFKRTTIN